MDTSKLNTEKVLNSLLESNLPFAKGKDGKTYLKTDCVNIKSVSDIVVITYLWEGKEMFVQEVETGHPFSIYLNINGKLEFKLL